VRCSALKRAQSPGPICRLTASKPSSEFKAPPLLKPLAKGLLAGLAPSCIGERLGLLLRRNIVAQDQKQPLHMPRPRGVTCPKCGFEASRVPRSFWDRFIGRADGNAISATTVFPLTNARKTDPGLSRQAHHSGIGPFAFTPEQRSKSSRNRVHVSRIPR
jgi:hypothetical protein